MKYLLTSSYTCKEDGSSFQRIWFEADDIEYIEAMKIRMKNIFPTSTFKVFEEDREEGQL